MTSHSRRSAALFPLIPPVHLPVSCRCTTHAPPLHGCALPPPPSPAYEQVHHVCVRCNPEDVCRLALSCVEVAVEVQGSCSKQLGFQHAGHLHMGERSWESGGGEGRGGEGSGTGPSRQAAGPPACRAPARGEERPTLGSLTHTLQTCTRHERKQVQKLALVCLPLLHPRPLPLTCLSNNSSARLHLPSCGRCLCPPPPPHPLTCFRSSSSARLHFPSCGEGASVAARGSPPSPPSSVLTALVTRPGASTTYISREGGCRAASSYCPAMARSSSCRPCGTGGTEQYS